MPKADKILIVYNICTILNTNLSRRWSQWDTDIKKLLAQNIKEKLDIVVVECRGIDGSWAAQRTFVNWVGKLRSLGVHYIVIKQYVPMSVAVNYAIKQMIKSNGNYEYYVYWSSGLEIPDNAETMLSKIYDFLQKNKKVGRATL